MQFGAVAFVLAETILRELRAKFTHNPIACDFRDHARGRDRLAVAISVDDGGLGERKGNDGQSIDQDVLGRERECGDGVAHGPVRCPQNVYSIDFKVIDYSDRPSDLGVTRKVDINFFAQLRGELLGIVQFPVPEFFRQNHGRGHNRAGERAAPGFIDPGDANDTDGAQFFFVAKSATTGHVVRRLRRFPQILQRKSKERLFATVDVNKRRLQSAAP